MNGTTEKDQLDTMSDTELVAYWNILQFPMHSTDKDSRHRSVVDELLTARGIAHESGRRTVKAAPLTLRDLEDCLMDENHHGWGYATRDSMSASAQDRTNKAIVVVANELGLTKSDLFQWTDSKYGRWLVDNIYGCGDSPTRATVRKMLNADAMQVLREGR